MIPGGPTVIEAEEITYDAATGIVTARGAVRVTHPRFRLSANALTYDMRTQVLTAQGPVRLIDAQGEELRGRDLVYTIPSAEIQIHDAETIVNQVYVRAQRVQGTAQRLAVDQATVTTCDPARPLYRLTTRRLEIVPGREVVAYDATLWLGSVRVVTLRRYRYDLTRPAGPDLPRLGTNKTDGLWIDYRYPYDVGDLDAALYLKYGTRSGFFAVNTLAYAWPALRLALDVGRGQREGADELLHTINLAELSATTKPWRIPGTPLALTAQAAVGWFDEPDVAVSTIRAEGVLTLATPRIPLGTDLDAGAAVGYRYALYGTGQQRGILFADLDLTYRLSATTTLTARYDLASVQGTTPFLFDGVDPRSRVGLRAAYTRPEFRAHAGISHDFVGPETEISAGVGFRVSPSFFFDVDAVYDITAQAFEEIDYTLTYRCDCLSVALGYRQVQGEVVLMVRLGVSDNLRLLAPAP